jgi:hypothetical protein
MDISMKCSKCHSKLVPLFTSAYCHKCDAKDEGASQNPHPEESPEDGDDELADFFDGFGYYLRRKS